MSLFTGKGDGGDTGVFDPKERISKASCQTEALGALDEINTLVGVCKAKARNLDVVVGGRDIPTILEEVQQGLFLIQAIVAGAPKELLESRVQSMERTIREIEAELPEIKTFFLPGGTELSGLLDYARAVSRRAERVLVAHDEEKGLPMNILRYMNRLSSLLYALVRIVNHKQGVEEAPPSY